MYSAEWDLVCYVYIFEIFSAIFVFNRFATTVFRRQRRRIERYTFFKESVTPFLIKM